MKTFGKNLSFLLTMLVCFSAGRSLADITTALPTQVGDCNTSMFANCDSMPDQSEYETSGSSGPQYGNWEDLSGGVSSRPYVTRFAISNGGTETVLLSDGTPSSSLSSTPGSIGIVITPTNLCDSTQTPAQNVCYATPNRVQLSLVYRKSTGSVGYNFSFPNDGSLSTTTGNAVPLKSFDGSTSITVDQNTIFDVTIALNTLGQSLRWSWMNGDPTFWATNNLGAGNATVRVKFKLANLPALRWNDYPGTGCTAIPVRDCEVSQAHSDWLAASMILSLDTTLSEGMTGALFATDGAIIGSVETVNNGGSSLPSLLYGLSSSHLDHTGATRSATLKAFLPDAGLVHELGIPSFSDPAAAPSNPADVLAVARVGSGTSVTNTFSVWHESTEGANGLLMTVSGITFSAPQYNLKPASATPKVTSAKLSSGKYNLGLTAKSGTVATTCKKQKCTVSVFRAATDPYSSTLKKVTSTSTITSKKGFSAAVLFKKSSTVKKNTDLLVVVKNKSKKVLSSTPYTLTK